jgi:hypothetical protein
MCRTVALPGGESRDLDDFTHDMQGQSHPGDHEIANLAGRQHGIVARWQLYDLGFERGAIEWRINVGRLHQVHKGVYAVGHRRLEWRGVLIAAVLAYGPEAVLSHRSAARLWGIRPDSRRDVDVTVPGRGLRRRPGLHPHCVRDLDPRDVTKIDGIPVTTLPRTFLDLAEVVPKGHVIRAITEAERQQIFDLTALNELLARSPGRRGQRPLREILADAVIEPATREEFEHRFLQFCHQAGLPLPKVNTKVEGYGVDAFWPPHTWRQLTREPTKLLKALL